MGPFDADTSIELILMLVIWVIIILYFSFQCLTTLDKSISISLVSGSYHFRLSHILQVVNDVVSETAVKQYWLLTDHTDLLSKVVNVVVPDILSIQVNLSFIWVVES